MAGIVLSIDAYNSIAVNRGGGNWCCVSRFLIVTLLASEASETLSGVTNGNRRYVYTPSTRQRQGFRTDIPLLRRCDIPLLSRLGRPTAHSCLSTHSHCQGGRLKICLFFITF